MNNSFNGTGTAFILYIVLAFCMPFVYVYRLAKRRKDFGYKFVLGHFLLGLMVTALAVTCVGYLWRTLGVNKHGSLHHVLIVSAYTVIVMITMWVLIPRFVRLSYRLRRKKALLDYKNPLIHPWFVQPDYSRPAMPARPQLTAEPVLPRER